VLSIVIPSRNERWLGKTVNDLFAKAEGEIEVIVALDGMWQDVDPRCIVIHQGIQQDAPGMRTSINAGMAIAKGEYVMKIDGHCMVDQGFDLKLIADCEDDWVVVPRRKRLDVEKWGLVEDGRVPIDYMFIAYPYEKPFDITSGLHGAEWRQKYDDRLDVPIDDLMTFQGSCYFMTKKHWERLGELDESLYGPFTHESQEISMKTWLSGGRVVVNKNTWYAHLHKGKKYGTGYQFNNEQWRLWGLLHEKGRTFCIDYWMGTKDYKYDMKWLIEKFSPMPTWPDDWEMRLEEDSKHDFRYSEEGKKLHEQLKEYNNV